MFIINKILNEIKNKNILLLNYDEKDDCKIFIFYSNLINLYIKLFKIFYLL